MTQKMMDSKLAMEEIRARQDIWIERKWSDGDSGSYFKVEKDIW